ncbi:hypothetical protein QEZ40_006673 [Streptomyces katrae]|uniref:Integral membrane protein n=1 Tax=Streptomyces katrae TaxID=68223 RepID=A0ABT7GQQ2_9ACTN|nr:hypothetical protein [Streptomyces katrae]MDK9495644.1 hypothetical protein [Streptomyces katrae]
MARPSRPPHRRPPHRRPPRAAPGSREPVTVRLREGADPGWDGALLGWSADTCVLDLPEGRPSAVVHTFAAAPGGPGHRGAPPAAHGLRPPLVPHLALVYAVLSPAGVLVSTRIAGSRPLAAHVPLWAGAACFLVSAPALPLRRLHSELLGDYRAWPAVGMAALLVAVAVQL